MKPGSMGRPLPGYRVQLLDAEDSEAEEGEISLPLDARPLALMLGYQAEDGGIAPVSGAAYRTGRRGAARCRGLPDLCRPRRRRVQSLRLPDQPVRAGKRADRACRRRRRPPSCPRPIRCGSPCRKPS
ncbi:MAG: hypothetical protein WDN69_14695 [Aliidongia sp.]